MKHTFLTILLMVIPIWLMVELKMYLDEHIQYEKQLLNSKINIDYVKENCYLYKQNQEFKLWKCKEGQILWIQN